MQPVDSVPRTDPYAWEQQDMDEMAEAMKAAAQEMVRDQGGEAGDGDEEDPDEWALRPEWEFAGEVGDTYQCWTNFDWEKIHIKMEGGEGAEEGEAHGAGDGEEEEEVEDEADDDDAEDNYPTWADRATTQAHLINNDRTKGGGRGKYIIVNGEPCFQASEEQGGGIYEAGMGRRRNRSRGTASIIRQKGKKKGSKGKGNSCNPGNGGPKGGGKGGGKSQSKHTNTQKTVPSDKDDDKEKSGGTSDRALACVETALAGQSKLIDLLCAKETKEEKREAIKHEQREEEAIKHEQREGTVKHKQEWGRADWRSGWHHRSSWGRW